MKLKKTAVRIAAMLLTAALLLLSFPSLLPLEPVLALDYTAIEAKLNTWQYYFCRTVMSMALKDSYDTGVLASITAGQSFYEGGCAGAPISIIAQNHFGIKAYSNWTGKVYDDDTHIVYQSYSDVVNLLGESGAKNASLWRAYDTWEEGIADHSDLLLTESKYKDFLTKTTYQEAAVALVEAGYCTSSTYANNLIKYIELYGFDQLDNVTADENGVFGMIMDRSRAELAVGETVTLQASAYPAPETPVTAVWTSADPSVASVDQNGNVTANKQGYTLITAVYNNKEACCIVSVDCNGYVMNRNLALFSKPDADSDSLGKLVRGQPVKINSETVYTDDDGTSYYSVSAGIGSKNTLVSGYASAANLYTGGEVRLSIGTPTTVFRVEEGERFTVPIEIYAEELKSKTLVWASSSPDVVSVTQEGAVTALKEGVSVVSVSIDGTVALTVTVYVGSEAYETLIANAAVYLRDAPDKGANILGTIRKGEQVKLILEPENGWYLILATIDGKAMEGYSYSRYFNREGEESSTPESSAPESNPETSDESASEVPSEPTSEPISDDLSDPSSNNSSGENGSLTVTYLTGKVNVDDALNVRDKAGMDGNRVARLKNGAEVLILDDSIHLPDEEIYKDWYRISFAVDGKTAEGYVCAEFIVLTGTVTIPIDAEIPTPDPYPIGETYLTAVLPDTSCEAFAAMYAEYGADARVFAPDGTQRASDETVCTGDTVTFYRDGNAILSRTAIVYGDANGNGTVDLYDYLLLRYHVLSAIELDGAEFLAAALYDDAITVQDYMILRLTVLGSYHF